MTLPYQCVAAIGPGGIVAATRGTSIFTFASNGSLISSWEHPATQQRGPAGGDIKADAVGEAIERDENESPSKKRKIETDVGVQAVAAEQKDEPTPTPSEAKSKDQKHTRRGRNATRPSDLGASEQPYVNLLKTTSTGSHLVAVTGTDKAVWVFEHDGKGQLKELSQR